MDIIIVVISIILAIIIVRVLRGLFMSIMGLRVMFVSGKSQLVTIFVLTLFLVAIISSMLGVNI